MDTIQQKYMHALTVVPAPKSWRSSAHVRNHIDALANSGRQWQGAVGGWSREESREFLQPEVHSRKDFFQARRLRMVRSSKHELPESLLETANRVTFSGKVERSHATRELSTAARKKILLSKTAINQKLKKWGESNEGREWKAARDKMFQADDPDCSSSDFDT
jgi:hypothetical protein